MRALYHKHLFFPKKKGNATLIYCRIGSLLLSVIGHPGLGRQSSLAKNRNACTASLVIPLNAQHQPPQRMLKTHLMSLTSAITSLFKVNRAAPLMVGRHDPRLAAFSRSPKGRSGAEGVSSSARRSWRAKNKIVRKN